MKKLFLLLCLLTISIPVLNAQNVDSSTFVFIRHAEKANDGSSNPSLTKEGKERAERVMRFLKKSYVKIDAIFSTDYERTLQTAQPSAKEFSLPIKKYDPRTPEIFLKSLSKDYQGGVVLIVGHSNTTPFLVNKLLGESKFEQLDESAYDEMFIVSTNSNGKAKVEVKSSAIKKN